MAAEVTEIAAYGLEKRDFAHLEPRKGLSRVSEAELLGVVRASYDAIAEDYAVEFAQVLAGMPLDRALLTGFAELVSTGPGGPVADVGCGPGRVTALLHDLGLPCYGIDLSPGMLAVARRERPDLRFELGSMLELDVADGGLGGLLAWYSIIHTPDELLPAVFAEFRRVLAPGAPFLVAFQVGDGVRHRSEGFGHEISLDFRRRSPDRVVELLDAAGLQVQARFVRKAQGGEPVPQATLIGRRTANR
jgi:SAM-dependent methyltransferase